MSQHEQHGNGKHQDHNNASHNKGGDHSNKGGDHSNQFHLTQGHGSGAHFDLAGAALDEMHAAGFKPEFGAGVDEQIADIREKLAEQKPGGNVEDLRALGWSSIDNDTSRDLDQIEVAERVPHGVFLRVAIGDVAAAVEKGSPIDKHAQDQTQTIYTAVKNFPMLPFDLSTDLTSLNEDADRTAVMMSFTVGPDGEMLDETVSRAVVRNRAQLAYSRVGPWLENAAGGAEVGDVFDLRSDSARAANTASEEMGAGAKTHVPEAGHGAPSSVGGPSAAVAGESWLAEQLKLQDEAAQALHKARVENGALEFHRAEADPVVADGRVVDIHEATHNRAMDLIEDLMVAANGVMARALRHGGRSGLQRVVRIPVRWDRIVALAAEHGGALPASPDSVALNNFLEAQRKADSIHYPDLAVAVIKLMGPGEYMLMKPDDDPTGHFGLAARDYTHSTAPNRRFPDLVTQRILHAMVDDAAPPYADAELMAIAQHCNDADKALRKIERDMEKRVAAVALASRIGQTFSGVVTGASDKGVYVRTFSPPAEGRVMQGGDGLDVGDKVTVKLIHTDPQRAFIDFAAVGRR
jgi:exoribonuclease R